MGLRFIPMVYPGNRLFPFRGIMFLFGLSVIVKEKDLMRKKLFRFYIKGDREELLETSSHAFTFPALSPGNYELWVSYSKKNGDWSVPLRLLAVDVEPPLWRCAWFLIAMGGDCVCGNWRDDLVCYATQRTETCLGHERT